MTRKDRVYLHLSIDSSADEGDPMVFDEHTGTYSLDRMVPGLEIEYFFTINGVQKYITNRKNKIPKDTTLDLLYVNVMSQGKKKRQQVTPAYVESTGCYPRPVRPPWPDDSMESEPEWDIRNSVFWGYIPDDSDLINKCFEYDWSYCKIPKIIKNEDELHKIKNYLKSIYKPIRETYKYYAGISPCSNIPCIGQNAFNEIINLTSIVDGKDVKLSDIDFEFIATKAGNK